MSRLLGVLLSFLIASSASAVSMDWTPIGNPGNACDPQPDGYGGTACYGAVGYAYQIGTYEVTNAQYVEFLNAKAASDPLGLYNTSMGNPNPDPFTGFGGITRSGVAGSYSYSTISGRGDMPVNYVSFYDALRFTNWMNNGQGSGDTETGSYTLSQGGAVTRTRNAGATIVLTSDEEWYKAAYYGALTASYFDYPAGSDTQTTCTAPTSSPNSANCDAGGYFNDPTDADVDGLTIKGSFTSSASPYGTFDQGGNVFEWNEAVIGSGFFAPRGIRGGSFGLPEEALAATNWSLVSPTSQESSWGFRVAMIPGGYVPEPSTGLLLTFGLVGLAGWRRVRA